MPTLRARPWTLVAVVLMVQLAALGGCSIPTDMEQLAGTYVMSVGTDTLRLEASGRYTRVRRAPPSTGPVAIDSGRWTISERARLVGLHEFVRTWSEHGRFDPQQGWHAPDTSARRTIGLAIGRTWSGRVALGVQRELGWRYLRVEEP